MKPKTGNFSFFYNEVWMLWLLEDKSFHFNSVTPSGHTVYYAEKIDTGAIVLEQRKYTTTYSIVGE